MIRGPKLKKGSALVIRLLPERTSSEATHNNHLENGSEMKTISQVNKESGSIWELVFHSFTLKKKKFGF